MPVCEKSRKKSQKKIQIKILTHIERVTDDYILISGKETISYPFQFHTYCYFLKGGGIVRKLNSKKNATSSNSTLTIDDLQILLDDDSGTAQVQELVNQRKKLGFPNGIQGRFFKSSLTRTIKMDALKHTYILTAKGRRGLHLPKISLLISFLSFTRNQALELLSKYLKCL